MPAEDHCCVFECSNRRSKRPDISFHVFPADPDTRAKWIQAVKREHFQVSANTVVCSEHFTPESFYPTVSVHQPGAKKPCRRVKKGAVPSLFSFRPPPPIPRASRAERLAVGAARAAELEAQKLLPMPGVSAVEFKLQGELRTKNAKIKELEAEVASLKSEVTLLRSQLFRYVNICDNEEEMEFLTGLNHASWKSLWSYLHVGPGAILSEKSAAREQEGRKIARGSGRVSILSQEDQLLLTLMRFRLGQLQEELAYSFGMSESAVSSILKMWISFLYLRLAMMPIWPEWDDVAKSMPQSFKSSFPDTFIILDATELRCEIPSSLSLQSQLYSSYKSHTTVKGLVGIAPNGTFTFISQLFTGCISDKQLVVESGIIPLLDSVPPGKRVMADRGFAIQDLLVKPGLILNIPPFKGSRAFMPKEDVVKTQIIASVRIHVERAIGRVKSRFHIFDKDIPLVLLVLLARSGQSAVC